MSGPLRFEAGLIRTSGLAALKPSQTRLSKLEQLQRTALIAERTLRKMHDAIDEVLALPGLTDWQRTVFRLCELEGRSVTDAALMLGCNRKSVLNAHSKARRVLAHAAYYDEIDRQQTVGE